MSGEMGVLRGGWRTGQRGGQVVVVRSEARERNEQGSRIERRLSCGGQRVGKEQVQLTTSSRPSDRYA